MDQKQRLEYLTAAFIADSKSYKHLKVGNDEEENRRLLRSLMNIRMPGEMDEKTMEIQDEYLQERNRQNGIVSLQDIPTIAQQGSKGEFAECISLWQGDITRLRVDAIVNAANEQMLGCFVPMHSCIDNCIHTYAGIQLRAECESNMKKLRQLYGEDYRQPTALPMLTSGYNLPASHVIHVVGPIVEDRLTPQLEEQLAECYVNVLDMCRQNGLKSVAFCCISTGVFRFPAEKAAEIAVETVRSWLKQNHDVMERVIFNVFKDSDRRYYEQQLFQ
jgi:O-acetyl-ADP-ribose deacetylase (regulator of RNase III)